ncbi:MAG: DUF3999 family protein [Desulfomonilaceae bacterium]
MNSYYRTQPHGYGVGIIAIVLVVLLPWGSVFAEFSSRDWKRFRNIQVPADLADGPAGFVLESGVIDKCRPDVGDLRIVDSNGMPALVAITDPAADDEARPFPAQIFRVAKTAGKWTDIAIDKTGKILTSGLVIGTRSKNFIRKVEIRGSDNVRDAYVIRMDGLIADAGGAIPLSSLKLNHPLNNFQYIYLRILDGDQPPLKIDSIQCCPPDPETPLARSLDVRILENRQDEASGSTRIIADLGEKRLPLTHVAVSTPTKEFVKGIRIHGASSPSPDSWKEICEDTVFRLHKEDAVNEHLKVRMNPQSFRYILIELYGRRPSVAVEKIAATATMRLAIFEYRRGLDYKLFYDNPAAEAVKTGSAAVLSNLRRIVSASSDIRLGEEQQNVVVQAAKLEPQVETRTGPTFWRFAGVAVLAVGLLLMFSLMLRARSLRKSVRGRNSRVISTRTLNH